MNEGICISSERNGGIGKGRRGHREGTIANLSDGDKVAGRNDVVIAEKHRLRVASVQVRLGTESESILFARGHWLVNHDTCRLVAVQDAVSRDREPG